MALPPPWPGDAGGAGRVSDAGVSGAAGGSSRSAEVSLQAMRIKAAMAPEKNHARGLKCIGLIIVPRT
jgi:hypothetical protein